MMPELRINSAAPAASAADEFTGVVDSSTACGGDTNGFDAEALKKTRKEVEKGCKRPRFIWTDELHQIFVNAVNSLTLDKAVPRKILEYMKNQGVQMITRGIVASHLQKYRLNLRKHVEVDKSSKLSSPSIYLNLSRDKDSSWEIASGEEITQRELLWRREVELQKMGFSDVHVKNEHICPPNNLSTQFFTVVNGNNNNNYNNGIASLINDNSLNEDCLHLKILREYEEAYKAFYAQNMHTN